MGNLNPNKSGMRRLGDWLREQMEDRDITIQGLVDELEKIGYSTNVSKIQRLRDGVGEGPDGSLLRAIAKLELLKKPSGEAYSLEELFQISCGEIDPYQRRGHGSSGSSRRYERAIAAIRQAMAERNMAEAEFAKLVRIPIVRFREILKGEIPAALPTWDELGRLAAIMYADKKADRLSQLYGYGAKVNDLK